MNQDTNKIVDILNAEWANDAAMLRKRIAIISEENHRLKQEIEKLKEDDKEKENAK